MKKEKISFGKPSKKYRKEEIRDARKWFKNEIKKLGSPTGRTAWLRSRIDNNLEVGKLVFYKYDPKTKDTLPFWDTFPLAIVVNILPDGWQGLNLHYLPPNLRVLLFTRLLEIANNTKFDKTTKLKITYGMLKGVSKYKYFIPCFKRYLGSHVKSNINIIRPSKWPHAILLPSAKFKNADAQTVWKDSRDKIRKH